METDTILRFTHRSPNSLKDHSCSVETPRDLATLIGEFGGGVLLQRR
jgi:hypothetical protein